jgi:hypothetical protein
MLSSAPSPKKIVGIRVSVMWESCERTTYYVELRTDEGFTMTPMSHRTGSLYTNFEGLTKDEARERALCDAHEWGDFLCIPVDVFMEEIDFCGMKVRVKREPDFVMETYSTRRILAERRKAGEK